MINFSREVLFYSVNKTIINFIFLNAIFDYKIIESTNNAFKAKAIAITDFDGDGVFNLWQIDQDQNLKHLVKD